MSKTATVPLTDEQYVARNGSICPACSSSQIRAGDIEVDGATAWQSVSCLHCEATWNDMYALKGYSELEV